MLQGPTVCRSWSILEGLHSNNSCHATCVVQKDATIWYIETESENIDFTFLHSNTATFLVLLSQHELHEQQQQLHHQRDHPEISGAGHGVQNPSFNTPSPTLTSIVDVVVDVSFFQHLRIGE